VDRSACLAPSAEVIGRVTIGPRVRVMSGAVLDAEGSLIDVGEYAIVCEHAVLRATAVGDEDHPVVVGDHAFVSPHAALLGCQVEAAGYIALGGPDRALPRDRRGPLGGVRRARRRRNDCAIAPVQGVISRPWASRRA
jgi:hypothetical protein